MSKKRYYTVWVGHEPGVYASWDECEAQVSGYKGARYKGFATREEAEREYMCGLPSERSAGVQAYAAAAADSAAGAGKNAAVTGENVPRAGKNAPRAGRISKTKGKNASAAGSTTLAPSAGAGDPAANAKASGADVVAPGAAALSLAPATSAAAARKGRTGSSRAARTITLPAEVPPMSVAVDAACSGNPGMMEYRGVYLRDGHVLFHYGPVWGTNNIGEFLAIVHALALLKNRGVSGVPVYSDSRNAMLWVKLRKCRTKLQRDGRTEQLFRMIERAEAWLRDNKYDTKIIKWDTARWGEIPADFGRKH